MTPFLIPRQDTEARPELKLYIIGLDHRSLKFTRGLQLPLGVCNTIEGNK